MCGDCPLLVVTNLFWVHKTDPKERHTTQRESITQKEMKLPTEDIHHPHSEVTDFKNLNENVIFYLYSTLIIVKYHHDIIRISWYHQDITISSKHHQGIITISSGYHHDIIRISWYHQYIMISSKNHQDIITISSWYHQDIMISSKST